MSLKLNKDKLQKMSYKVAVLIYIFRYNSAELFAQSQDNTLTDKAIDGGIGLGSIIAVVASWSRNQSILLAILHGLFGWIYVVYFVFTREE